MGQDHRSHTQLSTIMRCQRKFHYAYVRRLKARTPSTPLSLGTWFHRCMEVSAIRRGLEKGSLLQTPFELGLDQDWAQARVVTKTKDGEPALVLFQVTDDEGKPQKPAKLGSWPLTWQGAHAMQMEILEHLWLAEAIENWKRKDRWVPELLEEMLAGYHHHHRVKLAGERPLLVEQRGSVVIDGVRFEFRVDEVLLDGSMCVLRDWKTASQRPGASNRLTQAQRMLFGLVVNHTPHIQKVLKRKVAALELDYAKNIPAPIPARNQDGSLSKRKITTTAPVYVKALQSYGMDPRAPHHAEVIRGMDAEDSYFWRDRVPLHPTATKEVVRDYLRADRVAALVESGELAPMRDMQASCDWQCDFQALCIAEMYGHDTREVLSQFEERPAKDDVIDLEDLEELA